MGPLAFFLDALGTLSEPAGSAVTTLAFEHSG
jgi:hypothetical protein